ncbi:hypothetical protein FACS189492_2420 [Clostridia bacterium]|nr:hypothetical protein FACS189492_2420 [Clostridia bacterium]
MLEWLTDWLKSGLIEGITANFQGMFNEVNARVGEIAAQVGQTPEDWNSGIFALIQTLSDTVIVPIAGMILTFVLCYELIHTIIEKNNMHDIDTFIFFKWIFKTFIATFILTHTFDIVMGVFGLAQQAVNAGAGIIAGSLNVSLAMTNLDATLRAMSVWELMGLYAESGFLTLAMKAISICIFIIVYARMIEIYLTISVAPIPFSTMVNHEWGQMGNSYLKSLFALAFQGFLIMVCVGIYAILLQSIAMSGDIHIALWTCAGYTVLLCFILFKTGSLARQVFSVKGKLKMSKKGN